ncbi:MAG: protein translocase subunit SecD [Firmicutes bacterium]|nr:protein translocase subunit SecD [Bacillota bacterium]
MKKLKPVAILLVCLILIALIGWITFGEFPGLASRSAKNIHLGLDLAGGVSITYQAEDGAVPSEEEMKGALSVIQRRLDTKGYTEASAYLDGTNRIRVEIPGVEDASKAVEEIGRTAMLAFYGLNSIGTHTGEDILNMAARGEAELVVTGQYIKSASFQKGKLSSAGSVEPYVKVEFDEEGTRLFAEATQKYYDKQIAIMLDDSLCSEPLVKVVITDGIAVISGMKSDQEAQDLASDIIGGALPVQLQDIEHQSVGATLGQNALTTSILAGILGFAVIVLFMLIVYRVPGLAASISLFLYVSLELLIFNLLGWTLTLPGIAGFILSIGMAVDANVIIFARIREEIVQGHTIRLSIRNGFSKALSAILDGNITTLIAAVVLYLFGSGTIRGFAQTLGLGILLSMVSALFVTRFLLVNLMNIFPAKKGLYAVIHLPWNTKRKEA